MVVTLLATLAAWPGLGCADAVGLPMPDLRRLDGAAPAMIPLRALIVSAAWGAVLGLGAATALRSVDAVAGGLVSSRPPWPSSCCNRQAEHSTTPVR